MVAGNNDDVLNCEHGSNRVEGIRIMKLVVLGATGGTGLEIIRQAVERGHSVTAFVRSPELEARDWKSFARRLNAVIR